ncbi:cell wall-binding repeat-containing protein [Clostridium drakei]|uniref:Cell surface protein n=1 Tax=Clostridium drakei TaxID=332101 RepID=A0A2U8DU10_9CLOT|nr:cell wall-binding repeat-containing protein [Clostridium drakei]AWI05552.1 cell surface protein [Clostridium drakei]
MKLKRILGLIVSATMLFSTTVFADSSYSLNQKRIFGRDRYETSALISQNGWEAASTVVICNGENFPDALCAAPLAKKYNAPILLTNKSNLSESTKKELSRLNPSKIIIIGGSGVITDTVLSEIKIVVPKASDITRLGGATRYDTSKIIADKVGKSSSIVLVSGKAPADALSISYIAANKGMPILLADNKDSVIGYSKNNSVEKAYIIGGESVISKDIDSIFKNNERIYGKDRYDSNEKILEKFKDDINFSNIYLASAEYNGVDQFADALSVSALAAKNCNPIILVNGAINKDSVSIIKSKVDKDSKITALGGTQLVAENILTDLANVKSSNEEKKPSKSSGGGGGGSSSSTYIFAGGNGTVSSPYEIASAAQLNKVRDYLDKNFVLAADIDLSSYANWEPIGAFKAISDKPEDEETPDPKFAFRGSFNGNGHSISNLKIDRKNMAIGLFGCIIENENKSVVIHNLIVKNVNVTGYNDLIGGVIGHQASGAPIEKIELIGDNKITGNDKSANVGGIVGGAMNSNITDCKSEANIIVNGDGNNLVGILGGGFGNCSLSGCSAKGSITVNGKEVYSIGGLAGCIHEGAYVKDCSSDVTIVAAEKDFMVGGLIGHAGTFDENNPTVISNCTVKANIKAAESASRIGGVVGSGFYIDGFEYYPTPSVYKVENCNTEGSVIGGNEVGTVAGYAYNSVLENCTSTMTVNDKADAPQIGKSDTEASLFAGGSGTKSDPYQIANASQFNRIRRYLDKNYILTADIDLSTYENWEPIGAFKPISDKPEDEETPDITFAFSGIFNGNGHKTSNIHISRDNSAGVGLFGCVAGDNASIQNLVVENVTVLGKQLVGGVIGYGSFKNDAASISLIGKNSIKGGFLVGGIVGGGFCNIKNCNANAEVTLFGDNAQGIGVLAGGMEGCSLISCSATGTVTALGKGNFSIAGLSGAAQESPSVENCNADVIITVGENSSMVGGLLGNAGTYDIEKPTLIKNCSVNASIKAADSAERIGGIVGGGFYLDAYKDVRPVPTVYKVVDSKTSGSIDGGKIIGTIAGHAYNSKVENCTSTMTVNGNSNAVQIGKSETVKTSSFAGGSGTEGDPYQIATADQLNSVRKYLDKHFKLTADIDLASYENWEPIGAFDSQAKDELGYFANAFTGTFDGDNHTISNLTINKKDAVGVGLIGAASKSSVVKNLKIENIKAEGSVAVGSVIGYNKGLVENITLSGTNSINAYSCASGIVGGNEGGTIKNCNVVGATINMLDNISYISPFVGEWKTNIDNVGTLVVDFNNDGTASTHLNGKAAESFKYFAYKGLYFVLDDNGNIEKIAKYKFSDNGKNLEYYGLDNSLMITYQKSESLKAAS